MLYRCMSRCATYPRRRIERTPPAGTSHLPCKLGLSQHWCRQLEASHARRVTMALGGEHDLICSGRRNGLSGLMPREKN